MLPTGLHCASWLGGRGLPRPIWVTREDMGYSTPPKMQQLLLKEEKLLHSVSQLPHSAWG